MQVGLKAEKVSYYLGLVVTITTLSVSVLQYLFEPGDDGWKVLLMITVLTTAFALGTYMFFRAQESHSLKAEHQALNQVIKGFEKLVLEMRDSHCEMKLFMSRTELYRAMSSVLRECADDESLQDDAWAVSVTSFIPRSPKEKDDDAVLKYHSIMEEIIARKIFQIRRIASIPEKGKAAWIEEQVRDFEGNETFSLRWHRRSSSLDPDTMIPLNIQIYGNCHLFIIDPRTNHAHQPNRGNYRHVYFRNPDLVRVFEAYYSQLWLDCEDDIILDKGALAGNAIAAIHSYLQSHEG